MNLHIIQTSGHSKSSVASSAVFIQPEDTVFFIDEGIYNTLTNTKIADSFIKTGAQCMVIKEHLFSRGFEHCQQGIIQTSMDQFVIQTFKANNTISWY